VAAGTEAVRRAGGGAEPVGRRLVDAVASALGVSAAVLADVLDRFHREEYPGLRQHVRPIRGALGLVQAAIRSRASLCLASDPVFPAAQIAQRLEWGGLSPGVFAWVPGCDEMHALKPHPAYYTELATHLGVAPEECLMVGNDPERDGAAAAVGMRVFLLRGRAHAVADRPAAAASPPEGIPVGTLAEAVAMLDGP
jgi:FMN phosphatase YigB (HAD superfamily)